MEYIIIGIMILLIGCFGIFKTAYDMISFNYCKPKYRIGKNGYVEYYIGTFNYWDKFCGWDSKDTERTVTIHGISGSPVEIQYNGPGRIIYYFDKNISKKELRKKIEEIVNYKTGKECYEHQVELINNEFSILHNKVKLQYRLSDEK